MDKSLHNSRRMPGEMQALTTHNHIVARQKRFCNMERRKRMKSEAAKYRAASLCKQKGASYEQQCLLSAHGHGEGGGGCFGPRREPHPQVGRGGDSAQRSGWSEDPGQPGQSLEVPGRRRPAGAAEHIARYQPDQAVRRTQWIRKLRPVG